MNKDIEIGTIIGDWKVISNKYKKNHNNIYYNDCECVCGLKRSVRTWHLINEKTLGCGCTNVVGRYQYKGYNDLSLSFYNSFKNHRKSKGFEWSNDLTIEFLWDLFIKQNKKCAISGVDIVLIKNWTNQNKGKSMKLYQTASIDRIDNNKGYNTDNVQWVHKTINLMRGQLSVADFIGLCHIISSNNKDIGCNKLFDDKWKSNLK